MGVQYQGRCFESTADAAAAAWSGVAPVIGPGSPPVVSVTEWTGTGWQVASYEGGALLGVQVVPTIAFGSCDAGAAALDGMTLAWLVVGVWVAAWALRSMGRALGR